MNYTKLLHSFCAIVFIVFTFAYLFFFQADLLAMEQHVLSNGTTTYNRTIGSLVILAVLYLLQIGAYKLTKFDGIFYSLTYIPSFLLLALLTNVDGNFDTTTSFGSILFVLPIMLFFYTFFAIAYKRNITFFKHIQSNLYVARSLFLNLIVLIIIFLFTCYFGNTDKVLHYRLHMEALLKSGDTAEALATASQCDTTDASLTMLRAYALAKEGHLGEKLFEYPLYGSSEALLPNGNSTKTMLISPDVIYNQLSFRKRGKMTAIQYLKYIDANGLAKRSGADYLLCAYLLDKNLDAFVSEIMKHYNITSPTLPKHYKEALILYTHLKLNPVIVYHSEVLDADYADFQKIMRKYNDLTIRAAYVRDSYETTYWYYYFYNIV